MNVKVAILTVILTLVLFVACQGSEVVSLQQSAVATTYAPLPAAFDEIVQCSESSEPLNLAIADGGAADVANDALAPCPNGVTVLCPAPVTDPIYDLKKCQIQLPSNYCILPIPDGGHTTQYWQQWCNEFKPDSDIQGIGKCDFCHEVCHAIDFQNGSPRKCASEEHCYGKEVECLNNVKQQFCDGGCGGAACSAFCKVIKHYPLAQAFNRCVCAHASPVEPPCMMCVSYCLEGGGTVDECEALDAKYCNDFKTSCADGGPP